MVVSGFTSVSELFRWLLLVVYIARWFYGYNIVPSMVYGGFNACF